MNNWEWMVQDGLGSIRGVVDNSANPLVSRLYSPYGEPIASTGTNQTPFGFTGEPTDGNGLVYLRARYYAPTLGIFSSLDPLEDGNRYAWVQGNVVNMVDPSGMIGEGPGQWDRCLQQIDRDRNCSCYTSEHLRDLCSVGTISACSSKQVCSLQISPMPTPNTELSADTQRLIAQQIEQCASQNNYKVGAVYRNLTGIVQDYINPDAYVVLTIDYNESFPYLLGVWLHD